ncbi:MAG: hypothetical protein GX200_03980 [Firmicutes bacterium]|mgnify:FL=1|nr:hypothetical protein [Bacillota bacterium]
MQKILRKMREAYREARKAYPGKPLREIVLNLKTGEFSFLFGGKAENRELSRNRQP